MEKSPFETLFQSVDAPLIVDVEQFWIERRPEDDKGVPFDELANYLAGRNLKLEVMGHGLCASRMYPSSIFGTSVRAHTPLAWLEGLDSSEIEQMARNGLNISELDPKGKLTVANLSLTLGANNGGVLSNSNSKVGLGIEVMVTYSPQGDRPFFGRAGIVPDISSTQTPLQIFAFETPRPVKAADTDTRPTLDFLEGEITNLQALNVRIGEKIGVYFTYDARLRDRPLFVKGKWVIDDLLEAIKELGDTPRPLPFNSQELAEKYAGVYDSTFDALLEKYGSDELRAFVKEHYDGKSYTYDELATKFPSLLAGFKEQYGDNLPTDAVFVPSLGLNLYMNSVDGSRSLAFRLTRP